jgi:hypothetical protein
MRYLLLISFLMVGCGTAKAVDTTPETPLPTSGAEVPHAAPVSVARPQEDTLPPLMSPPTGAEILLPMAQGAIAPFPGVLLNVHGVAWLEAEPDAVQERAQAWVDRRVGQIRLFSEAEIERLQLRIRTIESEHLIVVRARDQQIESLTRINNELRAGPVQWWEQGLWIAGALIIGVAAGLIIGFVAN